MENAVDALKIAFGVMMFVLALTLSISSFSKANSAVTAITRMNDRETEYTYVEPTASRSRIVGVEAIVPSMYRAYYENIEIKFLDADGDSLTLYKDRNTQNGELTPINYINGENSSPEFLDALLKSGTSPDDDEYVFEYSNGLYNELKDLNFEEKIGEYYIFETDGSQIKTRVITYKVF